MFLCTVVPLIMSNLVRECFARLAKLFNKFQLDEQCVAIQAVSTTKPYIHVCIDVNIQPVLIFSMLYNWINYYMVFSVEGRLIKKYVMLSFQWKKDSIIGSPYLRDSHELCYFCTWRCQSRLSITWVIFSMQHWLALLHFDWKRGQLYSHSV